LRFAGSRELLQSEPNTEPYQGEPTNASGLLTGTPFYKFIKEHDALQLLFQRINSSNMEQFLEEKPRPAPAGAKRGCEPNCSYS
jgi:hypothetical protein